jgi:hypothetical protein
MKNYLFVMLIMICFAVSGCNTKGVPVAFANACGMDNDDKVIEVNGYLDDKGGVYCSNTGGGPVRCGFKLSEKPDSEPTFSADIERGTWANNVEELKSGYTKEDIKIRDNESNVIDLAKPVKLTGTLHTTEDRKVCYLTVSKIEK